MPHSKNSVSTNVLTPMAREKAEMLARRLTGAYPSLKLHDPEIFVAELITTLLKYPAWVGEQAIESAKKASPQFVPSVPMVDLACEEVVKQTREAIKYAESWERRAMNQLGERREIEAEDESEPLEYRREVIRRLWPRALDNSNRKRVEIPESSELTETKMRRFTNDDLESIYRRNEGEAAE